MSAEESHIHRGLEGVVVDTTRISKVMPEINALVYYDYPVQEQAGQSSFEEVAWLIWHGELPTAKQLAEFQAEERSQRELSADLLALLHRCPKRVHPMDVLRTGVSFLGMEDLEPEKQDATTNLKRSISLLAKIPTMVAAFKRVGSAPMTFGSPRHS